MAELLCAPVAHRVRWPLAQMKLAGQLGRSRSDKLGFARLPGIRDFTRQQVTFLLCICAAAIVLPGCGGGGSASTGPATISVSIQPTGATLFLGQTQQFQASASGASNTSVSWMVTDPPGQTGSGGTITGSGLYTAPAILPSPASATVTAISTADPQASASAAVTLQDDIVVRVMPPSASVPTGGGQVFNVSITATGNPVTTVTWSVNGVAGGNSTLGTIVANGTTSALYSAGRGSIASNCERDCNQRCGLGEVRKRKRDYHLRGS